MLMLNHAFRIACFRTYVFNNLVGGIDFSPHVPYVHSLSMKKEIGGRNAERKFASPFLPIITQPVRQLEPSKLFPREGCIQGGGRYAISPR